MSTLRSLLPDAIVVIGVACALTGAFLLNPAGALLLLGVFLVGLGIWMGA